MTEIARDPLLEEDLADASRRSAAVVVPLVLRWFPGIRSVAELGCAGGAWLAEFSTCGVPRVLGIDLSEDRKYLFVPREAFRAADPSRPLELERHDLALSLEAAQRFPDAAAPVLVRNLTAAADLVLFSAAAPLQGGDGACNARWPSYWVRRFRELGYRCHDVLRPSLWHDRRVEWWYRQNLLLFVKEGVVAPALDGLPSFGGADLVHPERLAALMDDRAVDTREAPAPAEPAARAPPDLGLRLLPPRSGLTRTAVKLLLRLERALWRVRCILRGEPKATFHRRWQVRLDEKLVLRSGLFDAAWYLRRYPDAAGSGLTPVRHYLTVGARERRDPGPGFSAERYVARHPWIVEAGLDPLLHFLREQLESARARGGLR